MKREDGCYGHIGVLFTDTLNSGLTHSFFSPILNAFKKEIEKNGYYISFLNIDQNTDCPLTYMEQIKMHHIDGVFVINVNVISDQIQELFDAELPVVTIDFKTPGAVSISSDNISGIKDMVTYVNKLGHTKLAYMIGDSTSDVSNKRKDAFIDTCADLGIPQPEEYIRECNFRDMQKAALITEELLALPEPPSCIFYPDDYAAVGGMNILRARGLEIPRDISYCGFDGVDLIGYFEPRITTVKQNVDEIGKAAGSKLIELIESGMNGDGSEIIIPTSLEEGKSVNHIY